MVKTKTGHVLATEDGPLAVQSDIDLSPLEDAYVIAIGDVDGARIRVHEVAEMLTSTQIWECARFLTHKHGPNALKHAENRLRTAENSRNLSDIEIWRLIALRIMTLSEKTAWNR